MEMLFNCTLCREPDLCILLVDLLPSLRNETPCLVFMLCYNTCAHSVLTSKETSITGHIELKIEVMIFLLFLLLLRFCWQVVIFPSMLD